MKLSKRYDSEYTEWLNELKSKIQSTQIKAALSANKEMILLYFKKVQQLVAQIPWGHNIRIIRQLESYCVE